MGNRSLNQFYYESPDEFRWFFEGKIQSHSNLGIPPLKFIEDFGPQQDGSTLRDWRINPRTIEMDIFIQGDYCGGARGELLAEMISIIRPNRGASRDVPGWLRFYNDAAVLMEIPVHVLRGPSGDFEYNGEIGKYQVSDSVQFYAADPIWREFEKQSISVSFDTGFSSCLDDCLDFDASATSSSFCLVPTTFTNQQFNIIYTGTWDGDQIDITLTGPLNNPIIENRTLGKTIELAYNIPSGDIVTITIRPEFVIVEDNNGNNLIGSITSISDLVDFIFESPGEVTPTGLNEIVISGTGTDVSSTAITVEYWIRHISAYGNPQLT